MRMCLSQHNGKTKSGRMYNILLAQGTQLMGRSSGKNFATLRRLKTSVAKSKPSPGSLRGPCATQRNLPCRLLQSIGRVEGIHPFSSPLHSLPSQSITPVTALATTPATTDADRQPLPLLPLVQLLSRADYDKLFFLGGSWRGWR